MYAVIMAGGKGARFWPRSRRTRPKHLLDITGQASMIQDTAERIGALIPPGKIFVVTSQSHAEEVARHLPALPLKNILKEPVGRNTAPCIGLAAIRIGRDDPDGIMIVLPSDHFIANPDEFIRLVSSAAEMARKGPHLVAIGIEPSRPETGFGYMEQGGRAASIQGKEVYRVRSFREKPTLKEAEAFIREGGFLWNSGIFIWKVSSILSAMEEHMPELFGGLREIAGVLGTSSEGDVISDVYGRIQSESIDNGVLEKSSRVLLVKGDFGWNDVGSWDALWDLMEKDDRGMAVKGLCVSVNSEDSLVLGSGKLVALVDVKDLIVVDNGDSVLICRRGSSQDVRKIVDILEQKNMKDYL